MIEGAAVIHFDGTGNILVGGGILKDGTGLSSFAVNNIGAKQGTIPEESKGDFHDNMLDSCASEEFVQLLFKDTSSIDVVIKHLEALKEYMEARND